LWKPSPPAAPRRARVARRWPPATGYLLLTIRSLTRILSTALPPATAGAAGEAQPPGLPWTALNAPPRAPGAPPPRLAYRYHHDRPPKRARADREAAPPPEEAIAPGGGSAAAAAAAAADPGEDEFSEPL
jgi:hypothetical protein